MTNYITKGIGGFYYVKPETGIVECRARGIFRKRGITPVAGDQVVLSADRTTIDEILPRKNVFIRPPVANLDVLFIVASTTQPVPSTLILDELTAAAVYKDVQPPSVPKTGSIFPAHRGSRYPTMNTRFRTWGTRKSALLSTIHSTRYPRSLSVARMAENVRPWSCVSSPGTFSSRRYAGRLA